MRIFKKTKWFELFIEIEGAQILNKFYDSRFEFGTYELWLGRCYFVLSVVKT